MHKGKNEVNKVKILFLIFLFIPTQTLFWNIVSEIEGHEKYYTVIQFVFAAVYSIYLVLITRDRILFDKFWDKHPIIKKINTEIQHCCIAIWVFICYFPFVVLELLSFDRGKQEVKKCIGEAKQQYQELILKSNIVKTIFPIGVIALTMIFLIIFEIFPEKTLNWIQEIINMGVSLFGLAFVIANLNNTSK